MTAEFAFVANSSRFKSAILGLLSLVFVFLCLLITGMFGHDTSSYAQAAGWTGSAFFGLCSYLWMRKAIRNGLVYRIDGQGIYDHHIDQTIPWTAIRSASVVEQFTRRGLLKMRVARYLVYDIDPEFPVELSAWKEWAQNWSFDTYGHSNAITVTGTDQGFEEMLNGFKRFAPERLCSDLRLIGD